MARPLASRSADSAKAGGGGRTRTYEGVSQRIYSPPPLPLGTFPLGAVAINVTLVSTHPRLRGSWRKLAALLLGIFLIVVGAIIMYALNVNIAGVEDNTLGWILIVAGAVVAVLGLLTAPFRLWADRRAYRDERDLRYR